MKHSKLEQLGIRCLAQGHLSRGIEGGESAIHSNSQPFDYESDSLTIRSRLPHERYTENTLTHEFLPESAVYLVM